MRLRNVLSALLHHSILVLHLMNDKDRLRHNSAYNTFAECNPRILCIPNLIFTQNKKLSSKFHLGPQLMLNIYRRFDLCSQCAEYYRTVKESSQNVQMSMKRSEYCMYTPCVQGVPNLSGQILGACRESIN